MHVRSSSTSVHLLRYHNYAQCVHTSPNKSQQRSEPSPDGFRCVPHEAGSKLVIRYRRTQSHESFRPRWFNFTFFCPIFFPPERSPPRIFCKTSLTPKRRSPRRFRTRASSRPAAVCTTQLRVILTEARSTSDTLRQLANNFVRTGKRVSRCAFSASESAMHVTETRGAQPGETHLSSAAGMGAVPAGEGMKSRVDEERTGEGAD